MALVYNHEVSVSTIFIRKHHTDKERSCRPECEVVRVAQLTLCETENYLTQHLTDAAAGSEYCIEYDG